MPQSVGGKLALCVAALTLCFQSVTAFCADPPKIERLFPPGGQRGTTVECKVTGSGGDGALRVWSQRSELEFQFSEKMDTVEVKIPEDVRPGLHWLRFYNEHGATDLRPFLIGLIPEKREAEPNSRLSESQIVESTLVTINGVLEKSEDVDIFGFTLTAGQTLVASVEANQHLGSPMDAVLQLLDENGTVVDQNNDRHGLDPRISFKVPADGIYHLRLFAFPATPNSTIKLSAAANHVYRLTCTTGPMADFTLPAVVNPSTDKTLEVRGQNIDNDQRNISLPSGDGDTIMLTESFALPLEVATVSHKNLVETPGAKQKLTIPSSITGTIATPGEKDTFQVSAKKGQNLTIAVAANSHSSPLDPLLTVATDSGKVLKEADDRSREDLDAEAKVKIPADGTYDVTVADRYGFGGEDFFYVLTCAETQPTCTATVKANNLSLNNDKPLEVPITIERADGFSEKVEFRILGLPDGVTAEPIVSENEGDSKKNVKLNIVRGKTAPPFAGDVQIVGTSLDSKTDIVAKAPIANSKLTTPKLWLTVIRTNAADRPPDE